MATTTTTTLPTGTWQIDASHSTVGFVVRHLVVAKVRGRFSGVAGTLTVAADPLASTISVTIDPASVSTGDDGRDTHLRSADFFDVEQHPTWTFVSTGVREAKGGDYVVSGDLTLHGVTRPVELDLEFNGVSGDPWGGTRAGFSATTEISRSEFGLTWNAAVESGGVVVSDKVKIELDVEVVLDQAA